MLRSCLTGGLCLVASVLLTTFPAQGQIRSSYITDYEPSCVCAACNSAEKPLFMPAALVGGDGEPAAVDDEAMILPGEAFASAPTSYAPNMIGDTLEPLSLPIAGGDRRMKAAENNSAMTRNRFAYQFNAFNNGVNYDGGPINLYTHTLSIERTLADGLWSVAMYVPIADGLDSRQVDGLTTRGTEFGNLSFNLKRMLYQDDCRAMSAGLALTLPTASNFREVNGVGATNVIVENEAVFLQPYVAYLSAPTDLMFVNAFASFDFDTNGRTVRTPAGVAGVFQEQNLMFLDAQVGFWLYRNACGTISGIAPVAELHYTKTLNETDTVAVDITNTANHQDILNLTAGSQFELYGGGSMATVAVVVPLREGDDRLFDSELVFQFNRYW